MSTVHSRMPLAVTPYTRLQNGKAGYSEVLTVPAANTATMADHVNGLGTYGAPLNPSGDVGHDHSGGYFGRPMFISVVSTTLNPNITTTGVVQPAKFYLLGAENSAGGTSTLLNGQPVPVWIPPCDPKSGAYVQMAVRFTARVWTTTLVSSDTVSIIVKVNDDSHTFSLSNPHVTGVRTFASSSSSELIATDPGAVNNVSFSTNVVRAAGGSSRGFGLYLEEIEFGVFST